MSPLDQGAERVADRFDVAGGKASQTGERQLHVIESQRPALGHEQASHRRAAGSYRSGASAASSAQ
jgi:hypothetical protein